MMKTKLLAILILIVIAVALFMAYKPHKQNLHYFAATCVLINDLGEPKNQDEFVKKMQAVIINENSSYAFDKVAFDRQSAVGASLRYFALSPEQKKQTRQGLEACLPLMLPGNN